MKRCFPEVFLAAASMIILSTSLEAQDTSSKIPSATWQSKPVSIDGMDNDWPSQLPYYNKESGINYSITNDSNNLYVFLKCSDYPAQFKILNAGLSVFFNKEGKKRQTVEISYPIKYENESNTIIAGGMQKQTLNTMKFYSLIKAKHYELDGFVKGNGKFLIDSVGETGVQPRIGLKESGDLIYEAIIPFSALFGNKRLVDLSNKPVAVGVMIYNYSRSSSVPEIPKTQRDKLNLLSPDGGKEYYFEKTKFWQIVNINSSSHG